MTTAHLPAWLRLLLALIGVAIGCAFLWAWMEGMI